MGKAFGNKKAESKRSMNCKGDNYNTPYSMTEQLFEKEEFNFHGKILEPAAGEGAMVKVLKEKFKYGFSCDINKPSYSWNNEDKNSLQNWCLIPDHNNNDFLFSTIISYKFDYIITNPPYSLANEFVLRAKEMQPEKFCFLLRTNFLSGQYRLKKEIFNELARVYIFNRMPDLRTEIRPDGKFPTAMIVYAWFVWERGYQGKPMIDWINCSRYVLHKNKR